jgi:hypothetical protein
VLQFDAAGKLLNSWGGPGAGTVWPGREHGIFVDSNDFIWIGGRAGWPRQTTPGVSDDMILKFTMAGKFVMQIGHSGQGKGNLDTENVRQSTDVRRHGRKRCTPQTATQQARRRVRLRKLAHSSGPKGNPPCNAGRERKPQPQTTGPPEGFPRHQISRDELSTSPSHQQPHSAVYTGRKISKQVR